MEKTNARRKFAENLLRKRPLQDWQRDVKNIKLDLRKIACKDRECTELAKDLFRMFEVSFSALIMLRLEGS
jgi:hypothetical protein